jgi:hypothetical protein
MTAELDPKTRAAAAAVIIAKRDALLKERADLLEKRAQLQAEQRRNDRDLADCRAAARLLGLDVDFPADDRDDSERRSLDLFTNYYSKTRNALMHGHLGSVGEKPPLPLIVAETHHDAPAAAATDKPNAPLPSRLPVRIAVLKHLLNAGAAGAKAAAIREEYEREYGIILHEKTVGMTLYRLAKEGLARRKGHFWFSVHPPQRGETENPGGEAPGSVKQDE